MKSWNNFALGRLLFAQTLAAWGKKQLLAKTVSLSPSLTFSQLCDIDTLFHWLRNTHKLTHSLTHSIYRSISHSLNLSHTYLHIISLSYRHTHTLSLSLYLSIIFLPTYLSITYSLYLSRTYLHILCLSLFLSLLREGQGKKEFKIFFVAIF